MGRRDPGAGRSVSEPYRDGDDEDAVFLRANPETGAYHDVSPLPSYDELIASESGVRPDESTEALLSQDRYAPTDNTRSQAHGAKPASREETSTRMDARLNDPNELCSYISDYLSVVPPDPQLRVRGTHQKTTYRDNKKQTENEVDFDVIFSLQSTLASASEPGWWQPRVVSSTDVAYRGSWKKQAAPAVQQELERSTRSGRSLFEWCQDYCDSQRRLKVFHVERTVSGFDSELVRREVGRVVRATNYQGQLDVTFSIKDRCVDIYSPHRYNRWRTTAWVRWLCYVTFLWLITWPLLFFWTARWAVYRVDWSFSRTVNGPNGAVKAWARISEDQWVRTRANLIQSLALERFQGDASELSLNVHPVNRHQPQGRAPRTGHAQIDSAIDVVQGSVNAWDAISGRETNAAWGADEH